MDKTSTQNQLLTAQGYSKVFKILVTVFLLFVNVYGFSKTSTLYDFNTASQLTEVFNSSVPDFANVIELTTSGVGIVRINIQYGGDPVTNNRGAAISDRGFLYSSSNDTPTVGERNVTNFSDGIGTGAFSKDIGGYYQAYATNSVGTTYGGVESFSVPASNLWFVDASISASGVGTSWATAFKTIQEAVDAADGTNDDIIVVAQGTYTSATGEVVLINPSKNFSGVKMYGSYEGTEVLTSADLKLDARDLVTNTSIIDGEDVRRGITINSFSTGQGLLNETIIDGFTIQNGRSGSGAGLYIQASSGSTMSPVFRNIQFLNNTGTSSGGAIYMSISSTISQPIFDRSLFKNNSTNSAGGAIYSIADSGNLNYRVINSIFDGNTADEGGAIGYDDANSGRPEIINSTFYNNSATDGNDILAVTFMDSGQESISFVNSIFIQNEFGNINSASGGPSFFAEISYSLVSEADATALNPSTKLNIGAGMFYGATAAATLTNAAGGDFTLVASSPALNVGNNSAIPAGITLDYAGNDRIQNTTIDMGALEAGSSVYTWTAGSSSETSTVAGNWNLGIPPAGSDILIPTGATPYPVFGADFEAGDLEIQSGATFTMAPTFTLTFAAGKGATGDGKIILKSDATGDASIGDLTGAGSIAVAVQQERFLAGGNRAFRFFSHPYTTAVPLSVLADSIDVTGVGGAANGFTTTATNAPSAFRFDPLNADGNEDNDGGWEAFTNTSQTIGRHEAIRILFRGSKGQGSSLLDDGSYTPDPVTIEWEGTINQGTQNIALVGVAVGLEFSDWNLVGNPFPSAIDLSAATHSGVVSDFSVWRPRQAYTGDFSLIAGSGRGGAYLQEPLATSSVKIPSGGGFFIRAGGTTATLTIPEPAKTSATPAEITNVLRMEEVASKYGENSLQLTIEANNDFVDRVLVFLDNSHEASRELQDAPKMANPLVNFFTVSADDWALAIDRRGYEETEGENRIPLHLQAPNYSYTLSLPDFEVEEGRTLRLYDRFTEEYITLAKGKTYDFEVTDDPSSKGHRFDIVMGIEVITSINPSNRRFQAFLLPNPAQEQVRISIQKPDNVAETNIRIVSMAGVEVRSEKLTTEITELDINLSQLSKGIYLVEITHGTERIVKRLIVN